jgi:hypothetical protein
MLEVDVMLIVYAENPSVLRHRVLTSIACDSFAAELRPDGMTRSPARGAGGDHPNWLPLVKPRPLFETLQPDDDGPARGFSLWAGVQNTHAYPFASVQRLKAGREGVMPWSGLVPPQGASDHVASSWSFSVW